MKNLRNSLIILILILSSCASRKKQKHVEVKKETLKDLSVDNSIITTEDKIESRTTIYEPMDDSKPFFVEGKEYKNAKVVETTTKKELKVEEKKNIVKQTKKDSTEKNKDLKVESNNLAIYFFLFVLFLVIAILVIKKFKII